MRLNKTLTTALLAAGSIWAAGLTANAQDATNNTPNPPAATTHAPGGPGARNRINFEAIAKQLALTDDQMTKAKPVFEEMFQKQVALRKETNLDETEHKAKVKEIRDEATAKLKDILTPEQLDKWQKMTPGRRPAAAGATPAPATNPAAASAKQ